MKVKILITVLAFLFSLPSLGAEESLIKRSISDVSNGLYKGIDGILIYKNNKAQPSGCAIGAILILGIFGQAYYDKYDLNNVFR